MRRLSIPAKLPPTVDRTYPHSPLDRDGAAWDSALVCPTFTLSRRGRLPRRLLWKRVTAAPVGCSVLFGVVGLYDRRPPNSSA
jgi:hypothetical protein